MVLSQASLDPENRLWTRKTFRYSPVGNIPPNSPKRRVTAPDSLGREYATILPRVDSSRPRGTPEATQRTNQQSSVPIGHTSTVSTATRSGKNQNQSKEIHSKRWISLTQHLKPKQAKSFPNSSASKIG